MRVNWREKEIKLLLTYYKRMQPGEMHKTHPLVLEASKAIRDLELNKEYSAQSEKFRNPNGIALKLANFLFLDPTYEGKGMKGCSALDKKIFNEENTPAMNNNEDKYPSKFENWLASNNGSVRRPMDKNSGRPLGNQVIKGKVHALISEMVNEYELNRGKYICVFIGGPGNGKTDIMEFVAEELVTCVGDDWSARNIELEECFSKNNRQAIINLSDKTRLILTQDASQKDRDSKDFCEAIFHDLLKVDEMDSGLYVLCMNRGILEEVNKQANNENKPLHKYKTLINQLYRSNSLDASIEDIKVWGNTDVNPYSLYSWSMDLDTLFQKSSEMKISENLIKEIFEKGECAKNYVNIDNELSPINSTYLFLNNLGMGLNFAQILRSYEILYAKRFTYRELFNVIGYLFNYTDDQQKKIKISLNNYVKIANEDYIERFKILFNLYKKTYSYRFFDNFLMPKKVLKDKIIKGFKDGGDLKKEVKAFFDCFTKNVETVYGKPDLVENSDFFDPIGCSDDIQITDRNSNKLSFDQLRKKVIYNTDIKISEFDNFLSPLEIELIDCVIHIKQKYYDITSDDINHRNLNALDSLKSFLNVLILSFIKRSLFFSNKYIRDKAHIDSFLNLIEGEYTDRQTFAQHTFLDSLIDADRKVQISLVTSIGQTPSQFNNNVFIKGLSKHIEAIRSPVNKLPSLDQIILRHQNSFNEKPNSIVITYKIYREILRVSNELLKGCFDKNFTLWQELKKSEIVKTDTQINEITISGIGNVTRDSQNDFTFNKTIN